VTQLRNKMLEELQRLNYSHRTAKTYIRIFASSVSSRSIFTSRPTSLGPSKSDSIRRICSRARS
jgi:hypothetical protein